MEDEQNLSEQFNFACVLKGEVRYLKEIKDNIEEYVDNGLVELINPVYDKKEICILKDDQWREYQKLKDRDDRLIGT